MLLVYTWSSDHQHIVMIVPTAFGVAQNADSVVFFDRSQGPMRTAQGQSVARLAVELGSEIIVVIGITETGFAKCRFDGSIETVVDIFPSMLLNEFGMTAMKGDNGDPTIGQGARYQAQRRPKEILW